MIYELLEIGTAAWYKLSQWVWIYLVLKTENLLERSFLGLKFELKYLSWAPFQLSLFNENLFSNANVLSHVIIKVKKVLYEKDKEQSGFYWNRAHLFIHLFRWNYQEICDTPRFSIYRR